MAVIRYYGHIYSILSEIVPMFVSFENSILTVTERSLIIIYQLSLSLHAGVKGKENVILGDVQPNSQLRTEFARLRDDESTPGEPEHQVVNLAGVELDLFVAHLVREHVEEPAEGRLFQPRFLEAIHDGLEQEFFVL